MRDTGYEQVKERARERAARLSAEGRDISPIPAVQDPERRKSAVSSFRVFCEAYFPETFTLPWCEDHLKAIARIEYAVLQGGLFALAMPRGSGKTSLCETACLWAMLTAARRFVALIGSDEGHAMAMLDALKSELECNERLLEDFPGAVYPVRCLEGIANRCKGQLYRGERTHIEWTAREIVLATIPDEPASGAIVKVAGLTGRIRGMKLKRPDGSSVRPDLVVLDDPQTDESARSLSQCATRESILAGAVLGLGGPGKKIAGCMPCTVIRPGDMADRILDRDKHPEWQGERTKMIYTFPERTELWDHYDELLHSDPDDFQGSLARATAFYGEHRADMDAGAQVAWPERFEPGELSGVQHAMNKRLLLGEAFWAEYQNAPLPEETAGEMERLTAEAIAAKLNGRSRGTVPGEASVLTAFVDVHPKLLYCAVCAWAPDFTGYVIDYGTYPDQQRAYFAARDVARTLRRKHSGTGVEGAVYAGLEALCGELVMRKWPRDDGAAMGVDLCLIDQGWQRDVVHQFCRQSGHGAVVMPSRGAGITASLKPISEYDRKRGDRIGFNWYVPVVKTARTLRHIEVDTNFWKSFLQERLATAMGDRGCLSLWGRRSDSHRLFSEHIAAEYRVRTEGRGRTVDEWKQPPSRPDNHWLDCLVGCAAGASYRGVALSQLREGRGGQSGGKIKLSDLQRRKQRERARR